MDFGGVAMGVARSDDMKTLNSTLVPRKCWQELATLQR
jgi:hypothetical protein